MAYSFDQIFAADPANPQNVASNAAVLIYAPGDATKAPLTITDPSGGPLANPVIVNANGFGSAFMHATLDRVAWDGGGFSGFFTSYEGMKQVAVAAQTAAESAAATAGVDAAAVATAAIGDATADADAAATSAATAASNAAASASAAATSASLVGAPADTAMATVANNTSSAFRGALNATILDLAVPKWKANTAYLAGAKVLSPSGDVVSAKVDFTSGASFNAANWDFILDTSQSAHMVQIVVGSGSAKNGMRIVNNGATYALKLDQFGVHDAVNIAANFTGAHTPFSVNSNNTTLSTVKIVNAGPQSGGAIIVGVGSDPTRTAQIIQADNYGAGASFLATQEPGATGIGMQIQYLDAGSGTTTYNTRALWIAGHHTGGSLVYIENDKIQTTGNLMQLVQSNASSTADCLVISPFGSGVGLRVNTSGASNLIVAGNFSVDSNGGVRSPSIVNNASFSNSRVQLTTTGTLVDRTVADNNPVLRVQNSSATSTGDVLQAIGIAGLVGSRFNKNAYFITNKSTAPADGDLNNGDAAVWIDPTPGTGGVRWKIKCTDGSIINKTL